MALEKKVLEEAQNAARIDTEWKDRYEPIVTSIPCVAIYRLRPEHVAQLGPKYICPFCYDHGKEVRMAYSSKDHYFRCQTHPHETFQIPEG